MNPSIQKVAQRHLAKLNKRAGGAFFKVISSKTDVRKAFEEMFDQAIANGAEDEGGYSGTIYDKPGYKIVSNTPMPLKWYMSASSTLLEKRFGQNGKWDAAYAAPYAIKEGGSIKGWVFWGVSPF